MSRSLIAFMTLCCAPAALAQTIFVDLDNGGGAPADGYEAALEDSSGANVWNAMAAVETHNSARPYLTNTAGPRRNSPLPIDRPSASTPGPHTASQPSPRGAGGTGKSAGAHGARPERASRGRAGGPATCVCTAPEEQSNARRSPSAAHVE